MAIVFKKTAKSIRVLWGWFFYGFRILWQNIQFDVSFGNVVAVNFGADNF